MNHPQLIVSQYKIGHYHLTIYEPCTSPSKNEDTEVYFSLADSPLGCAFQMTEDVLIVFIIMTRNRNFTHEKAIEDITRYGQIWYTASIAVS